MKPNAVERVSIGISFEESFRSVDRVYIGYFTIIARIVRAEFSSFFFFFLRSASEISMEDYFSLYITHVCLSIRMERFTSDKFIVVSFPISTIAYL